MIKKISYMLSAILVSFVCVSGVSALAPTLETNNILDEKYNFFANGTSITINAREDGVEGAKITWDGGEMLVSGNTNIFGGSHDSEEVIANTSITMYGGKVRNIFGGGLHKSNVTNASIVIYGGTPLSVNGGGASSASWTTCHQPWYATSDINAINKVENTTVVLNGGASGTVYGGNEGMGYTGNVKLIINDGTWGWVTAGAANGYTGTATTEINGGTITVLQSVNRGTTESANMVVNGGAIDTVYVAGETGDKNVTGGIRNVSLNINGGSVTNLEAGKNNNVPVTSDTTDLTTNVTYVDGTVENATTELPVEPVVIKKHNVIIDKTINGTVEVSASTDVIVGSKVVITVTPLDGYRLAKLEVIDAEGNVLEVNDNTFRMPDSDVTIKATFEVIPDEAIEENPNTYDGIQLYFGLCFVGLMTSAYATKKIFMN